VIIDRWQPSRGGAERALSLLVQHLEARGHEAHVFAEKGPPGDEAAPGRLHRVGRRLALSRGAREGAFGRAALAAAKEAACDVTVGVRHLKKVDLYWPHGGSHVKSVVAWNEARAWPRVVPRGKVARLTGRHGAFVEFERALLQGGGARRVACVSEGVARELGEDFPASRDRFRVTNGASIWANVFPIKFLARMMAVESARMRVSVRLTLSPMISIRPG
jgi:hypothetical protein